MSAVGTPGDSAGVHPTTIFGRNASGHRADGLRRWQEPVEGVVAVDALANRGPVRSRGGPAAAARYPRARGRTGLPRAVELSDARAGSPMESRLRMVLVLRGLPVPEVQYPVLDDRLRQAVWLDMAYPEHR